MKILITQRELKGLGGSEIYTVDIARGLAARGHSVAVYCPRIGDLTKLLGPSGVYVKSTLGELPWAPEIIHGQHHLQAMAAFARFPDAAGVYVWHGARPWVERPPIHQRIARYVAIQDCMIRQLQAEFGVVRERVVSIRNFVDTKRFSEVRAPNPNPRRALLYHQPGLADGALDSACEANGMSLDKVGPAYGNCQSRPEVFLPTYDIVFATGRSALEALACGCGVIPVVPGLAGQLITDENFDFWASQNFSPRLFTSGAQIDAGWLNAQLERLTATSIARTTAKVREEYHLDQAIDRLELVYREAIEASKPGSDATVFAPYLEWLSQEVDQLWVGSITASDAVVASQAASTKASTIEQALLAAAQRIVALESANNEAMKHALTMESVHNEESRTLRKSLEDASHQLTVLKAAIGRGFDPQEYLKANPDVAEAGMDPVEHLKNHGLAEGRPFLLTHPS